MTSPTFYKFLRGTLIAAALVFMPMYAFADYYVATTGSDSNSGTQSAPFRTIQKAANNATAGGTVHVAPGTYAETITSSISGTASARIRYVSDTKWGAKIVPLGTGGRTMWTVPGGYIDIDGFQIDGTGGTNVRIGIALHGGNSSVRNSLVQHVAENSGCDNMGGAGLLSNQAAGASASNYDFIGNVVHHVGAGCGWIQGIYHQSTGTIKNNLLYANSLGIAMYHDDHNTNVVNNTIFGNSGYGINFGGCEEAYNNGCPTSGINIYNNIIYDNHGGIQGAVTANDVNNVIHNNLVFGNTTQYDLASPSLSSITGAVNADPQFVNYIRGGGGDYHLKSTSPAIDKGSATYAPTTDLDGKVRPQGAGYDIGAYEYGGTVTPPPPPPPADTTAPTVAISAPLSGTTVSGTAVPVSATASDNIGVVGVQFKFDGANFGTEDTSAPYGLTWNTTATANGSHTITAVARDAAGNTKTSTGVTVTVQNMATDTTAPSTPTNLSASAVSSSQINLTWTASTDNVGVTGYKIYRSGTQIATVTGTTYSNTGLTASTAYTYTVAAYDAAGNTSAQSAAASATTQAAVINTGITTLQNGTVLTALSGATGATHMYSLTVPTGATNLRFVSSGGAGDLDLYVKFGSQPTSVAGGYDLKSDGATTAETISIATPQAGTYYLLTNGWAAYSGVSLVGAYTAAVTSAPAVSLSPTSLSFGGVPVGTVSMAKALTITNTGTANLSITSGFAFTGDFAGSGNCYTGTPLIPGASCVLNITFTPTVSGTRTGTVTITTNAVSSPNVVQLSGTGGTLVDTTAPTTPTGLSATAISSSQINLTWTASTDNVGVTGYKIYRSGTQIATVTGTTYSNTGLSASTAYTYTVAAYDAGGNTSAQSASVSAITQATVTSTGITTLSNGVTLTNLSGATGVQHMYQLTVPSGATNLRFVSSGGTGDFDLFVKFGSQPTMTTYDAKSVGATTAETVSFAAPQAGTYYLLTNGWAAYSGVSLVGAYTAAVVSGPAVSLSPTSLSFGAVPVGTVSTAKALTITNLGTANLSITTGFAFTGDFNGNGNCSTLTALIPGANCVLNVTFTPTVSGNRTGTVTITSNAASSPNVVQLSGTGGTVVTTDTTAPTVAISAPLSGTTVSGTAVPVSATASDNIGVVGVQFKFDGANFGTEDTSAPYGLTWNTTATANGSHTITAVARDAAGNTKTSAGVTVNVQNTVTTSGNNLYVSTTGSDSNPGTQAAPFRTINKAASVVSAGTTVHVAPGTYAETITSSISGTASARIRYVSDTKWGAKIAPLGTGGYIMWSVPGGYTDIDGFQIDGTGGTGTRIGIALTGGNSSVKNSLIHHVAETSGCDNQGGAGLLAHQAKGAAFNNDDFVGNTIHHVGGGCGYIQGIYHQSSGIIKNNIVYAASAAIGMGHDDHNIEIVNNTLFGNSGYGIKYGGCTEAYTTSCPTSGIKVYNNIIYDNSGGISGPITSEDVNNEVHNNLVFGNNINYDLASPSSSTRTGEVNADPQFVNYIRTGGGDYHLKSTSPAIDKGTATYAPATDMDGVARPQGSAVDIGAYER